MEMLEGIDSEVLALLRNKKPEDRIAVIGASSNAEKYGNIIIKNLLSKGYTVVPINPKGGIIEGLQAYTSVAEVPEPVALATFVVPPAISKKTLASLRASGVDKLWFQDGSFDAQTIELAKAEFPHVVHNACIMVVSNYT
jgi:predicted CoA-binding protein